MRKHVQIGPSRYRIRKLKWDDDDLGGGRGFVVNELSDIGLREDMPDDMMAEVLLHEILHSIWYTFSVDKKQTPAALAKEEHIITLMSTGLATTFVQNPWLLDYLKKGLLKK